MNNKVAVAAVLAVAIIVGGGGGLFVLSRQKNSVAPVVETQPTPTPIVELTTWKDQSEYSFQYPKDLILNPHEEDQENYSHIELTSSSHPGNIISWTKDTTAKDIESWVKQQKISSALDTTLGNISAKKVLGTDTTAMTITTVKDGYLYQIEANLADAGYWNPILDTIVSSYAFTGNLPAADGQSAQSAPAVDSVSSDVEYEGEEIIE